MPSVDIDELTAGMVLKTDVKNLHGQVILPKESVLSDKSIEVLRSWGAAKVEIQEVCEKGENPVTLLTEKDREEVQEHLEELFRGLDHQTPLVKHLHRLCLERKARKVLERRK